MSRQEAFRTRLEALMAEFGVRLVEADHYEGAGDERYAGTTYTFTGEAIALPVSALPTARE